MSTLAGRIGAYPVLAATIAAGSICYREQGSGEPMLLLHGVGSSSASWVDFMACAGEMLPGRRLIAWDAPGYGESTHLPDGVPATSDYAGALKAMLDSLAIREFVLVGHSLGGLIAGSFAAAYPGRVSSLVLLDPAGGYGALSAEARQKMIDGRLRMLADFGPEGMAAQRGAALLSPKASYEAVELVKWSMSRVDPRGYGQAVRMLALGRLAEDAAKYAGASPPGAVSVMCGTEDTVTPEEGCRRIAALCRGAEYRSLQGLGHASYVEAPRLVAAEIARFLKHRSLSSQRQQQ